LKEDGLRLNPQPTNDLAKLEELRRTLSNAWEERKQRLKQALEYQQFKLQADQADAWLATKEAFLNNDDIGVCIF
jgi:spectrin beta